jgi:hypothetical protein
MPELFAKIPAFDPSVEAPNLDRKANTVERDLHAEIVRAHPDLANTDGFVSLDQPRTSDATKAILAAAEGFVLVENGAVIAEFGTVAEAEAAR